MKSIGRDHYDDRAPMRSIYAGGLSDVFTACHDPLPSKMEDILLRLRKRDEADDTDDGTKNKKEAPRKRGQVQSSSN
jgi:hypothetical protein